MAVKKAIAKRPAHLSEEQFQPKGRSELTRLSAALGDYLNTEREYTQMEYDNEYANEEPEDTEGEEAFRREYPIASPQRQDAGANISDSIDEHDAADMLQTYRRNRDLGQNQQSQRDDIRHAYKYYR
jgi:hypothetical protein